MFENWAEELYDSTFSEMFDTLVAEFENKEITIEEIKVSLVEHQQVLLISFHEGEARSAYCNAMVDAHQYVLSLINKGKIQVKAS